ncbi:WLM domain-containing protein [Lipomyces japonicus]|uniref:WLM domain-containing protein n=1 Tax=Lipomyces japonicus TaxID=56871 RepID=UPI0034CF446C
MVDLVDAIYLVVSWNGQHHELQMPPTATLADLQDHVQALTGLPVSHQKLMLPKRGIARSEDSVKLLAELLPPASSARPIKLMLIGTRPDLAGKVASFKPERRPVSKYLFKESSKHDPNALQYTFHKLVPLPFLPNPEKSLAFLERLKADLGVQAVMRKYKWSVPVLTELDPASNTTRDSKCLGLNRNMGQVIELRLRTDAYDGWRHYGTVLKTLCHELAHNVYSPGHDAPFWKLTAALERQVVELNPYASGNRLTDAEFYIPPGHDDEQQDSGAWNGGEFVLGIGESAGPSATVQSSAASLSPRELMLRAAQKRRLNNEDADKPASTGTG